MSISEEIVSEAAEKSLMALAELKQLAYGGPPRAVIDDSLDLMSVIVDIEERLDILIDDEGLLQVRLDSFGAFVADLYACIEKET